MFMLIVISIHADYFYQCSFIVLHYALFICVLFTVPSAQGVQSDNDPTNTTVRSFCYFLVFKQLFLSSY
jgi:hypothetical protein